MKTKRASRRSVVVKGEVRLREMRFPECVDCKFFKPKRGSVECFSCGAGEYFEPKVDDSAPDDNELMKAFGTMGFDDE